MPSTKDELISRHVAALIRLPSGRSRKVRAWSVTETATRQRRQPVDDLPLAQQPTRSPVAVAKRGSPVRIFAGSALSQALPPGVQRVRGGGWAGYGRSSAAVSPGPFGSVIQRLIWVLEPRPSLLRMLVMWVSTVRSDKNSRAAICRLLRPSTTSRAISSCLRVSAAGGRDLAS